MRILNSPDLHVPTTADATASLDVKRVEVLENIVKSILQKLQAIEERIEAIESSPVPTPVSLPTPTPVTLDTEAVKKGLTKMWNYLNDHRAA